MLPGVCGIACRMATHAVDENRQAGKMHCVASLIDNQNTAKNQQTQNVHPKALSMRMPVCVKTKRIYIFTYIHAYIYTVHLYIYTSLQLYMFMLVPPHTRSTVVMSTKCMSKKRMSSTHNNLLTNASYEQHL